MPVQTLTLQQTAEVVTDLARGKTAATVAARRHLPVGVVDQMETLYGPTRADLSRNSKIMNKKLRSQPAEEFEVDVPVSPASPPRRAIEDAADGYHDGGPAIEALGVAVPAELQQLVAETRSIPGPVPDAADDPSAHTHRPGLRLHDCEACRDEAADPPVIVKGAVVDDEPAPADVAHLNGKDPAPATMQLVAELAAALPSISSAASEETPATIGATAGAGVVGEPLDVPGPGPSVPVAGWLAPGARTIERLLDEASRIDNRRIRALLDAAKVAVDVLTDAVEDWMAEAEQRAAILHELDILDRRRAELNDRLGRLNHEDVPAAEPKPDLTAFVSFDVAAARQRRLEKERQESVWYRLSEQVRARIRPWALANGVPVSGHGRIGKATVEAFLAAHPEDDPR